MPSSIHRESPRPRPATSENNLIHALAWFGSTISRAPFHAGGRTVERSAYRPDVEIRISSRFTARSLCRNRGPCWSARPPSLRCALRFGLLFSRFSVPPSLCGLSSHHQSHGPLSSFPGGLLLRPPYPLRPSCRPNRLPSHGAFWLLSG